MRTLPSFPIRNRRVFCIPPFLHTRRLLRAVSVAVAVTISPVGDVAAVAGDKADADAGAAPDTAVYVVPPIVVNAKRYDPTADLFNRSGFVAAVDLTERRERVEDLAAVLTQMVGVKVKQYGGLGHFATVSIRGSSASQVNVFLDGIPMNDAYSGVTNIADLPLGGVERVEVYRGFAPPHLGSGAMGGAINLVTTNPERFSNGGLLSGLAVQASYGSFDTSRQMATAWLQPWKLRVFAHGSHIRTLGNFPFFDNNGTPVNPGDDGVVDRANNDFESYGVIGRVEADVRGLKTAAVTFDSYYRDQGVAGLSQHQSTSARSRRNRRIGHVKLETKPFLANQFVLAGTGFYSNTVEQFADPEGTVALGRQDSDNTIESWGGLARGRWFVPLLPLSVDAVFEAFHPVDRRADPPAEGPDRWRRSYNTALFADAYFLRQTMVITLAQRWQRYVNEFWDVAPYPWLPPTPQGRVAAEHRSPSVGFRWNPLPAVTLKGNVGRYFRLPTFLELFGNLGSVTGNADLEPEEGLNRDVGVVLNFDAIGAVNRIYFEAVYLDNRVENLILFFPNSQQTTKPTNIGSARIRGWEFSFAAAVGARLCVSGNYTRLDARDTSAIPYYNGNQLASRPEHDALLVVSYRADRWRLSWEGHRIGANFLDPANMMEIPARDLHNVVLQWFTPLPGFTVTAEARNLTDDRAYDVSGFPLPGRSFYTTLSYKM
jgi:iron complex outermembrane receptor protein